MPGSLLWYSSSESWYAYSDGWEVTLVNNNSDTDTMICRIIAIQPKATSWATVSVKVNWLVLTIELFDFAQFFRYIYRLYTVI